MRDGILDVFQNFLFYLENEKCFFACNKNVTCTCTQHISVDLIALLQISKMFPEVNKIRGSVTLDLGCSNFPNDKRRFLISLYNREWPFFLIQFFS